MTDAVSSSSRRVPRGVAETLQAAPDALAQRVGALHLRQRLGIEDEREARVFGQGLKFFHPENWEALHGVIRAGLRLCLLHARGRRNALDLRVRENDVQIAGLPAAFEGYTLLHLSDLHLDMGPETAHVLSETIAGLAYDAAVLTGDFRASTSGPWEPALEALARVRPHLRGPVFAVLGNHDTIRMVPGMEELDVRVLLNESVSIERGDTRIHLAGIDDPHYFQAHNFEKACAGIPVDEVSVLLAHSPEVYRHAAHAGFDLMLCGHTHGGQICLPGGIALMYNARCPRELCAGAWRHHGLAGYTSVGSGVCVVDVRLNCPPEVTLHRLHSR